MYCIYCGKSIPGNSSFCPYCGQNQEVKTFVYCNNCGNIIEKNSSYCPYCGKKMNYISSKKAPQKALWQFPQLSIIPIIKNRYFIWYIIWLFENCILLFKSGEAYSNYFNITNVSPDYGFSYDKGIYPEDWFYPFRNIFSGIMGQDPVYVYDISEFIIYTIIVPFILALILYKRKSLTKSSRNEKVLYWVIWYASIWLLIFFPMGLFGMDILGWTFLIGGITIAIYAYYKIKELYANK